MRRLRIILLIAVLGTCFQLIGQIKPNESFQNELLEVTPGEGVFVHVNSSLLFPGEYLLYKVYVLNESGDQLSEISKIAYVELVGEKGNQVFLQKVALQNGLGQADFFVPTSVPSGNYKLVAYTNWMRNAQRNIFETDMVVINPYQAKQSTLLQTNDTLINGPLGIKSGKKDFTSNLKVSIDKHHYSNREKVTIELSSSKNPGVGANLSVSVRRTDDLPGLSTKKSIGKQYQSLIGGGENFFYLPEVRGEILSGTLIPQSENSILPLKDQKVALSIFGEGSIPKVSATDSNGRFFFILDEKREREQAWVEVIGAEKENFTIEMDQVTGINTDMLKFKNFHLVPEMEQEIIRRSVYNQIENAYFQVKPDTLVTLELDSDFMSSKIITYDLDDYKRFETVPETFVEIVNSAWIRKNSEGNQAFQVRPLSNSVSMGQLPLIVIDGVNIQDHEELINLAASKIKSVDIIRDKLYIGPAIYQGAILVKTVEGDYADTFSKPYGKRLQIKSPEIQQRYFRQEYQADSKEKERIPDFRYQLFWEPEATVGANGFRLFFYTSDVDGTFEVVIEGFTENGEPVSIQKNFTVQ